MIASDGVQQITNSKSQIANRRGLLGIKDLEPAEIASILKLARRMQAGQPRPILKNRRIGLLFYEPSTRTRVSFEFAAKALGASTSLITATASSIEKGESLLDTGKTVRATGADCIVIRHPSSGAPHLLAQHVDCPVINAGDGMHEHPTQALLDAYTMLRHLSPGVDPKKLRGMKVTLVGDILHSRVVRSNVYLLSRFGAQVTLCGPPELLPDYATTLAPGVRVLRRIEEALRGADVVMMLRVQKERLAGFKLKVRDYVTHYQLTAERLALAQRGALLMHPGPMIRGMEISGELAETPQSVVLEQVANGVPVRMAVLARALGAAR